MDWCEIFADAIGQGLPKPQHGRRLRHPYFPRVTAVDLARVGVALAERVANLPPVLEDSELCVELGRYLVGEAGVYLTRVIDRKESHGTIYLVTDGWACINHVALGQSSGTGWYARN